MVGEQRTVDRHGCRPLVRRRRPVGRARSNSNDAAVPCVGFRRRRMSPPAPTDQERRRWDSSTRRRPRRATWPRRPTRRWRSVGPAGGPEVARAGDADKYFRDLGVLDLPRGQRASGARPPSRERVMSGPARDWTRAARSARSPCTPTPPPAPGMAGPSPPAAGHGRSATAADAGHGWHDAAPDAGCSRRTACSGSGSGRGSPGRTCGAGHPAAPAVLGVASARLTSDVSRGPGIVRISASHAQIRTIPVGRRRSRAPVGDRVYRASPGPRTHRGTHPGGSHGTRRHHAHRHPGRRASPRDSLLQRSLRLADR